MNAMSNAEYGEAILRLYPDLSQEEQADVRELCQAGLTGEALDYADSTTKFTEGGLK